MIKLHLKLHHLQNLLMVKNVPNKYANDKVLFKLSLQGILVVEGMKTGRYTNTDIDYINAQIHKRIKVLQERSKKLSIKVKRR